MLAEVDENSEAFVPLRKAGFSVYAWQRMWEIKEMPELTSSAQAPQTGKAEVWTRAWSVHLAAIHSLYHQIVPPLLQPIESQPRSSIGWISNDGAKCYIGVTHGTYGIVLMPLIHPEARDVGAKVAALINNLTDRKNRPVYVCVRSYQAWLEPVLADLGAQAGQRQAVMVKHLARLVRESPTVPAVASRATVQPSQMSGAGGKK